MSETVYDAREETLEDLGRKGLRMIQRKDGFRFGEDTVLLSYFAAGAAPVFKRGTKALELGSGSGAAALLLSARRPDIRIDGIEVDDASFEVFSRNVRLNGLEDQIRPIHGDVRDFPDKGDVRRASYDFVFFNPPYRDPLRGLLTRSDSGSESLLNSRFEMLGGIPDFVRTACATLRPGGILTLVHRAVRLPEVMRILSESGTEPLRLRMIHPQSGARSTAFLLSGRKAGKPGGFVIEPPLILRTEDMKMTDEMNRIYQDGE